MPTKQDQPTRTESQRDAVIRLLWERRYEESSMVGKLSAIQPSGAEAEFGTLADKIIAAADPRQAGSPLTPIPPAIFWSDDGDGFFTERGIRMNGDFYLEWCSRLREFPQHPADIHHRTGVGARAAQWKPEEISAAAAARPPAVTVADQRRALNKIATENLYGTSPSAAALAASAPLTKHERELLTILMDECFDCYHRASKLLRYGRRALNESALVGQSIYFDNVALLAHEMGDLQHMMRVVMACGLVDENAVTAAAKRKETGLRESLEAKGRS